jgi:glutamate/tyrosine decarboxylase-like PLP-dependent enzyme
MYSSLQNDLNEIGDILDAVYKQSIQYLQELPDMATNSQVIETVSNMLPEEGTGTVAAMNNFQATYPNVLAASSGPRYWGFVTGGTTPASIAGDWLATVYDQNTQSVNGPGGYTALVEQDTIRLVLDLFHLPHRFQGGFVTGATMANFTGLAVARQWAGMQKGNNIALEGIQTDIKILAATPHSSAIKCLSMLGFGSKNIEIIKTLEGNREAMDMDDLARALQENSETPVIVISSGGTVNSVDFDDMKGIASLRTKYSFYWHVDAAFGGFAACSDQYRHLLEGWQSADSIAVDCHKWMNIPYDSAIYLVGKEHASLQVQTFQNSQAPYLGNPEENFSYLNVGPENSRRFRALPAWLSLQAYGRKGFTWLVEHSIQMAQALGNRLEKETIFTLVSPVRLNVVCFTTKDESGRAEKIAQTLRLLNEHGKVFMTPTMYKGIPCIRAAFVNWRTGLNDIDLAIAELKQIQ